MLATLWILTLASTLLPLFRFRCDTNMASVDSGKLPLFPTQFVLIWGVRYAWKIIFRYFFVILMITTISRYPLKKSVFKSLGYVLSDDNNCQHERTQRTHAFKISRIRCRSMWFWIHRGSTDEKREREREIFKYIIDTWILFPTGESFTKNNNRYLDLIAIPSSFQKSLFPFVKAVIWQHTDSH